MQSKDIRKKRSNNMYTHRVECTFKCRICLSHYFYPIEKKEGADFFFIFSLKKKKNIRKIKGGKEMARNRSLCHLKSNG